MNVKLQYEEIIACLVQDQKTRLQTLDIIYSVSSSEKPKFTLDDCYRHLRLQQELIGLDYLPSSGPA